MNQSRLWEIASAISIGGREDQQDRVAVFSDPSSGSVLALVADGLGGHAGGAAAAQAVVDTADACWQRTQKPLAAPERLLEEICQIAHQRILDQARQSGEHGHSTCALFYGDSATAVTVHVGDSRIYCFCGTRAKERTRDHSLVQVLLEKGEITEADIASHPDQNLLLRALGSGDQDPKPATARLRRDRFDGFLICTDGLWEVVTPEEMGQSLAREDLWAAAQELVEAAAERGGADGDNIAVALLRPPRQRWRLGIRSRVQVLLATALLAVLVAVAVVVVVKLVHWPPRIEWRSWRDRITNMSVPAAAPAKRDRNNLEDRNAQARRALGEDRKQNKGREDAAAVLDAEKGKSEIDKQRN